MSTAVADRNYRALATKLGRCIEGEARFDTGSRALYATDASNYRQVPIGVVLPRTIDDVVTTVEACREYGAPVLPRGGGTSLAGQCCNVAVVLDMSKYLHAVEDIDSEQQLARVQPGCVLDHLRDRVEPLGLTYGPDPATHSHNTIGGMIGNNSCGVHSVMAQFFGPGSRTSDQVESLDVLTYDGCRLTVGETPSAERDRIIEAGGRRGQIYRDLDALQDRCAPLIRQRYPAIPRRVSGFNLDELLPERRFNVARALVGSEGTCVVVLGATVKLMPSRPARALLVLGYDSVFECGDHVPNVLEHQPVGLEGIDKRLIDYMRKKHMHDSAVDLLPEGNGWLLVEFGSDDREEALQQARALQQALRQDGNPPSMRLFKADEEQQRIWAVRESGLGATAHVPGMARTHPGWEDAAVPPECIGAYLRAFEHLLKRFDYTAALYGHFGQGCTHCRIDFDFATGEGVKRYLRFTEEAADLALSFGGSLSGEHGDGQARAELLTKMFGRELVGAFRQFKSIWDPDGRMNPGKVVDPAPRDVHLRLGPGKALPRVVTRFGYRGDDGNFANAANRCVGVGVCRRESGGVMCPSYMATREERHSTRGRARLLFEMLDGSVLRGGWRDGAVREALDLCLACKGCKSDCPVNVDMATYKSEFMSHYYRGRLRPRAAWSMGLIHHWARIMSRMPRVVNFAVSAPILGATMKMLAGISPHRSMPLVAPQSFTDWFRKREVTAKEGRTVMLWPDTFNNFFTPEVARAAVHVLEAASYRVQVPSVPLCCGRPLYAWGMLDQATKLWDRNLSVLTHELAGDIPLLGLEPACVASFRDELPNLYPDDDRATALAGRTFLLSDFLNDSAWTPPQFAAKALVQTHCNHHAIMKDTGERTFLARLGLDFEMIPPNCCGMAGSFGMERDKYDVSMRIARQTLLPRIEAAGRDTLIIADGFSCREQIRQSSARRALHVAQVAEMAVRGVPPVEAAEGTHRDVPS